MMKTYFSDYWFVNRQLKSRFKMISKHIIDDAVSESFSRLIEGINEKKLIFKKNWDRRAWLLLTAERILIKECCMASKFVSIENSSCLAEDKEQIAFEDVLPDTSANIFISALDIDLLLYYLPEMDKEIIIKRNEGYKFWEISEMLGLKDSCVKMRYSRALKKQREIDCYPPPE